MSKYIVIYADEDGDVSVQIKSAALIEEWLDESECEYVFKDCFWYPGAESGVMIIKGEIIVPIQKTVAWRLP